jgi:N-acylglucosamine 2-epimerase
VSDTIGYNSKISSLAQYYRNLLTNNIVPFWEKRILDTEKGGYYNCFDREGNLYKDIKSGWFVGRHLYIFSALYNRIEKRQQWLDIAKVGRKFLMEKAYAGNGRFNYLMDRDGNVIEGTTSIFTDCFAMEGLLEYILASGDKEDIFLAKDLYKILIKNLFNEELWEREGIDSKYQKHAVNFMTLKVSLEALKLFEDNVKEIIDLCLNRSLYLFVDDELKAPLEYVSKKGKPLYEGEGRLIDPGHTLEAMWFSMSEGIRRNDAGIINRAAEIVDWVIERCWDKEYGGFYQYVDVYNTTPEKIFEYNRYVDIDIHWTD